MRQSLLFVILFALLALLVRIATVDYMGFSQEVSIILSLMVLIVGVLFSGTLLLIEEMERILKETVRKLRL